MQCPSAWQTPINNTLTVILDSYITASTDDFLIYLDLLGIYQTNVQNVFKTLLKTGLHLLPEKYKFNKEAVKYFNPIIRGEIFHTDFDKVASM